MGIGVPLLIVAAPGWFRDDLSLYDRFLPPITVPGIIFAAAGGALLGVGLHWRVRWKRGDPIVDEYAYPAAPTVEASERLVRRARAKIISGSVLTGVFAPLTGFSLYTVALAPNYWATYITAAVTGSLLATGGVLLGKGLKERRAMGEAYYRVGMRTPARRWSPFVGGVGPLPGQPRVITPTYGVNLQF